MSFEVLGTAKRKVFNQMCKTYGMCVGEKRGQREPRMKERGEEGAEKREE